MALTSSEQVFRPPGLRARIVDLMRGEHTLMQRLAGAAFLTRVASAVVAFGSQILLARWMGSHEFGIYIYVWTWALLFGQAIDFGLAQSAQRFIPEYITRNTPALLRGYLFASRWMCIGLSILVAILCAVAIRIAEPWLSPYLVVPLYLVCMILPAYGFANVQDGIARSYDWVTLAFVPSFLLRQLLITGLAAATYALGLGVDAVTVTIISGIAIWVAVIGQALVLNRRLRVQVPPGPRVYEIRTWLATSLPILLVEGFYLLLAYTDILVMQFFVAPQEAAVYYAAAKTLALVSFISWAIAATAAHRFSALHAAGDRGALAAFLATTIRWTFWPSLMATLLLLLIGKQVLQLFGTDFASGYHFMAILSIGLLARSALGPVEKLLNMLGEQRLCALVYAGAFLINLLLCLLLIPVLGAVGAAIATTVALVAECILLFFVTRRRLGFHVFIWGNPTQI